MSFPEKALQTRPVCAAENGACVNRRGRGGAGLLGGLPRRSSVCVIYPFWKIQTYKCVCCKARADGGHRLPNKGDTGSQTKLTTCRSPPPGPLSILTFVGFNENRSKGGTRPLARDQQASSLSPQPSARLTQNPGWERPGRFPSVPGSRSLTLSPCPSTRQKHPTLSS